MNRTEYVPVEKWGKDHWSTLAYIETRAVDAKGRVDNTRMRCNNRLHREFAHYFISDKEYPTILRDGTEINNHDDWSCVEDMIAERLIDVMTTRISEGLFGNTIAHIKLTDKGLEIASKLRTHKANGGTFSTFKG